MDLALRCPSCACENRPQAKFCNECGAALSNSALSGGDRRQAAVLFADISGYTELCASHDAEQVQAMLSRFFVATEQVVEAYGGSVIDRAGDAVMAVFGAPKAHGNDAQRAIRAAFDMHEAAGRLEDCAGQPLRLHIGVSSGEVVAADIGGGGKSKYSVTGATVNLAARLDGLAGPGETLISDPLHRMVSAEIEVQPLGDCRVKGFPKPVPVWRVLALRTARSERSRFVGRDLEVARAMDALRGVQAARRGLTIVVRGEAGIGKSRLVEEIGVRAKALGFDTPCGKVLDFGVRRARQALPTILRAMLGIGDDDDIGAQRSALDRARERGVVTEDDEPFVNDLLDIDQPPAPKSVFDAMDHASRQRRSAETFAAVLGRAAGIRPLLLTIEDIHWASPYLLRHLTALEATSTGCPMAIVLTSRPGQQALDPLPESTADRGSRVEIDLAPFSLEESMRLAEQWTEGSAELSSKCIERAEGNPLFLEHLLRSEHDGSERRIPPTVQSIVLESMDRLSSRDRSLLQTAAVLGQMFSLQSLRAVAREPDGRVDPLEAAGMIRAIGTDLLFAHALIQEAVYSSLLTSKRRELHARCAQWFAGSEPILHAQHLDRADSPEAAQAYLAASRLEAERFRFDTALHLAARATELAPAADLGCALALLQGELLRDTGQSNDSILAFRRALDLAQHDNERCHAWMGIAAGQRVTGELAPAMDALDRAEHLAERSGLATERSRIHHTRGNLCFARGESAACEAEHQQALDLARLAGNLECEVHALGGMADAHYAQARIAAALTCFQRCMAIAGERGWIGIETSNRCMAAVCLWLLGSLPAGIIELRRACEDARRIGAVPLQLLAVDTLAILLVEAGLFEEAERCCTEGLPLARAAGSGRYESLLLWNLGSCHIARGGQEAARRCIDDSLALARQTGLGSMGPAIYARLARAASNPAQRTQALDEGERLLKGPCLAHAALMFYREAIEASIAASDWDRTSRYASELGSFVRDEPLHWADLIVSRAKILKEVALNPGSREPLLRLQALREQVVAAGWASALVEIDSRLAAQPALH